MSETQKPKILAVGFQDKHKSWLQPFADAVEFRHVEYNIDVLSELTEPFDCFLCDEADSKIEFEAVQVLRMNYPEHAIYYVSDLKEIDRKLLIKNGFTDVLLFPIDKAEFVAKMKTIASGAKVSYRPVKLVDIQDGDELTFDTYLYMPVNKKHVRFSKTGKSISGDQLKKLKDKSVSSIQISLDQVQSFYSYSAAQLKKINSDSKMSETEKAEKVQAAVKNLVGDMFTTQGSLSSGKELMNDCQQIIKSYITSDNKNNWYAKLVDAKSEGSTIYSHAINVSTFASLFAMAAGVGNPENVALAGLLHDLGLANLPPELLEKTESEMTAEELAIYKKHPDMTMEIIKARKIIVSDPVLKIIHHHHENITGGGYPEGISGAKFTEEMQIMAIADVFDELITVKPGHATMTPQEALQSILDSCVNNPGKARFSSALVKKLIEVFLPAAKAA